MTFDPKKVAALAVDLHGRRVGTITRLAGEQQIFAFEEEYVDDSLRPTLSLSFKGRGGGLVIAIQRVHRRVPTFFSNLLPEGHLRTYLAERVGVHPDREFFLLAALGSDLTGAITVTPLDRGGEEYPLDAEDAGGTAGGNTGADGPLRFSLAGVQLKFSAVMGASGGLTIPAQGVGGDWIVKLPSMRFDGVSENEFAMLELARAIGIPVPRIRIVPVRDVLGLPTDVARLEGNALAVERFDRAPGGQRIHMEDFAQVFGVLPERKYQSVSYANVARVLWAETGEEGAYDFVRRLAFAVLIGNADMHLKNWSLLYSDGYTPSLSPAYDSLSTLPYIPSDQLALTFGGSRSLGGIELDAIRRFTDKAGMPGKPVVRIVRDTVDATVEAWAKLAEKDLLPDAVRNTIDGQIRAVAERTITALGHGER